MEWLKEGGSVARDGERLKEWAFIHHKGAKTQSLTLALAGSAREGFFVVSRLRDFVVSLQD